MQRFTASGLAWIQAAHHGSLSDCVHMHAGPVYASIQGAGQDCAYLTLRQEVFNTWINCMSACACACDTIPWT